MTAPSEADVLVRRVLDAVPARSHALGALLQLFRVEVTEDVPTACVTCERRPVLRVNPRFVQRHCRTDAHLFLLVMHELHHVLLGHTRLFPRVTPAHNVAFDAVINALLCARFPEEAYTSFFTNQYGATQGPLRLLAPPGRPAVEPARLAALHEALYEGRATADEVFHAIATEVGAVAIPLDVLLGSHGRGTQGGSRPRAADWGTGGPADPAVVDAIRRIVEKWPPPERPIRGRSLADLLKQLTVAPAPRVDPAVLAATRRALLGAADRGRKDARRVEGPRPALVPLPGPARPPGGTRPPARHDTPPLPLDTPRPARPRRRRDARLPRRERLDGPVARGPVRRARAGCGATSRGRAPLLDARGDGAAPRPSRRPAPHDRRHGDRMCPRARDRGPRPARPRRHRRLRRSRAEDLARAVERRGIEVRVLLTPNGWRSDLEPIAVRIEELPSRVAARREDGRNA